MSNIKITDEKLKQYRYQLGKLRAWHTGWTDAGKMAPPGSEVLWQLDMMLSNAENDHTVQTAAKQYFKENVESIGFKEQTRNQWADGYAGYDSPKRKSDSF